MGASASSMSRLVVAERLVGMRWGKDGGFGKRVGKAKEGISGLRASDWLSATNVSHNFFLGWPAAGAPGTFLTSQAPQSPR